MSTQPDHAADLLLIGAGRMGLTHLRALAASDQVRVAVVADPSPAARASAEEVDSTVKTYADLEEALDASVDGVLIAAPSTLHKSVVALCAQRRLPILCEKPCGTTVADIEAAADAADSAGVPLQIGYWRRFVPELGALRKRLRGGEFGELLQISCWQWDAAPPAESFRASSGGMLIDMGVHEFDQIRWLTGQELREPNDTAGAGFAGGEADVATATLELSERGTALVSLGWYFPHGDCVWVEVMGTRDHARVDVLWSERGDEVFYAALRAQAE
ncbi:MAG TPA: Gfo/Idh/MocA family oxidoreductase, partial [Candidatus Dormibacteraeota bacterium]|nr:Gfo/Idh/MocA family oxidoreductase [Candidatus Dormibacteraeota bacterium]